LGSAYSTVMQYGRYPSDNVASCLFLATCAKLNTLSPR